MLKYNEWLFFEEKNQKVFAHENRIVPLLYEKFHSYISGYLYSPMIKSTDGQVFMSRRATFDLLSDLEAFFKVLSEANNIYLFRAVSTTNKAGKTQFNAYFLTLNKNTKIDFSPEGISIKEAQG